MPKEIDKQEKLIERIEKSEKNTRQLIQTGVVGFVAIPNDLPVEAIGKQMAERSAIGITSDGKYIIVDCSRMNATLGFVADQLVAVYNDLHINRINKGSVQQYGPKNQLDNADIDLRSEAEKRIHQELLETLQANTDAVYFFGKKEIESLGRHEAIEYLNRLTSEIQSYLELRQQSIGGRQASNKDFMIQQDRSLPIMVDLLVTNQELDVFQTYPLMEQLYRILKQIVSRDFEIPEINSQRIKSIFEAVEGWVFGASTAINSMRRRN